MPGNVFLNCRSVLSCALILKLNACSRTPEFAYINARHLLIRACYYSNVCRIHRIHRQRQSDLRLIKIMSCVLCLSLETSLSLSLSWGTIQPLHALSTPERNMKGLLFRMLGFSASFRGLLMSKNK